MEERFSDRRGFAPRVAEITVREDAPSDLRYAVVQIAYDLGLSPKWLRETVCQVLRVRPDADNWSDFPNVDGEVRDHLDSCEWFKVYDIIEAVHEGLARRHDRLADRFESEINKVFGETGIGWQLADGTIEVRGEEEFEEAVHAAAEALEDSGRATARGEIREALSDLSRRPVPDRTGAIQHAMAALECVVRDVCGDAKATLGEALKRYPDLLPKPMDQAVEKAWGYASEMARHIREGREPGFAEAEYLVHTSAAAINYLIEKLDA